MDSYRLHTPYAQSRSPEHPPVSGLRNLLTDQWERPVNKTFCQTLHGSCSASQHCHRDIFKLTAKFVSHKPPPTINHHPSKYTQQSQCGFQRLFPSCKRKTGRTDQHSQRKGTTPVRPPRSLPVAQGILPTQGQEDWQLKPGRLVSESCFHMDQCNTISSRLLGVHPLLEC